MTRAAITRVFAIVSSLLLLTGVAVNASAVVQTRDTFSTLRLPGVDIVRIYSVPLVAGEPATLELERFEVWHPDAKVIVQLPDGTEETLPAPDTRYFRGHVVGDPDSLVFIAAGRVVDGLIITGDNRKFEIRTRREGAPARRGSAPDDVIVQEISVTEELLDGKSWRCAVEDMHVPSIATKAATREFTGASLPTGTANYSMLIAVDTDYELYALLGSSTAVTNYIGNLVGAASTIYKRDLHTELLVGDTYVYTAGAALDPWNVQPASGTAAALAEQGLYWHDNRAAVPRSSVVLLSAKNFGGGIAWISAACEPDFYCGDTGANCGSSAFAGSYAAGYAFNGSVGSASGAVPDPNAAVPSSNYWSLLQFAHELGHNVAGQHTHCVTLTAAEKTQYSVTRDYVDICYSGQSGCYSGATAIPPEKGTIMSYCHNLGGGTATRYVFGASGEPSAKMLPTLEGFIASQSPSMSAITAPASLAVGASGTASISAIAGVTYLWSVTNGTITGGQGTNAVTFTAAADPLTLRVTVRNANGCGATDSKIVSVTAPCVVRVDPTEGILPSPAGNSSVEVIANCGWTASTSSPFVSITAGTGTGNGTVQFSVTANGATRARTGTISVTGGSTFAVRQAGRAQSDFNFDAKNDLLWRNNVSGQNVVWRMNGTTRLGTLPLPTITDLAWKIAGTADFNGDQKPDIVWRNHSTGQNAVWLMNGDVRTSTVGLAAVPDLTWKLGAVGDFNGDGKADIVWRRSSTGQNVIWLMDGFSASSVVYPPAIADANWSIVGAADFNVDGTDDIIWRNTANGQNAVWYMTNGVRTSTVGLPGLVDLTWVFGAAEDFSSDGRPDLVWRNSTTGADALWIMNGTNLGSLVGLPQIVDQNWQLGGPR